MSFDHEFVRHPREVSHFVTLKWARARARARHPGVEFMQVQRAES